MLMVARIDLFEMSSGGCVRLSMMVLHLAGTQ